MISPCYRTVRGEKQSRTDVLISGTHQIDYVRHPRQWLHWCASHQMAIETCFASFGFPRITLNQSCIYGLKLRRFPGYVLVQNEKRGERG